MDWFSKKPSQKELQRENDKILRKTGRDVERDRRELEREEKKLEMEIKKCAKEGNRESCKILAKQLIQIRKQKTRTYSMNSKIQGVGTHNKVMGANLKLAEAMGTTSKAMANINSIMKPEKLAADMRAFQQANTRMEMSEELINDTLDDMLNDSEDEEASDNIVKQVLDEIGIEMSGKMVNAPSAIRGPVGESTRGTLPTDEELEKELIRLRSS